MKRRIMKILIGVLIGISISVSSLSQKVLTSSEAFISYLKAGGTWLDTEAKPLVVHFVFVDSIVTVDDSAHSVYRLNRIPLKSTPTFISWQAIDEVGVRCAFNIMKTDNYAVVSIYYANMEIYYLIPPIKKALQKELPKLK